MKQFGMLYRYELKKILKKKLVWVTFFLCMAISATAILADLTGSYYVDGEIADTHYNMFLVDSGYERQLSGRKIDQELLREVAEAYGKIPKTMDGRYTLTEEYQMYARPYSAIFNIARKWSGMDAEELLCWEADERELYERKEEIRKACCDQLLLTDREKSFWEKKSGRTEEPLTWLYHEGYAVLMRKLEMLGLLMLLLTTVCLSGIFPEEHMRRTDQMILCSLRGKKDVYRVKMLAGVSISAAAVLLMTGLTVVLTFGIYGTEGFEADFMLFPSRNMYSYPLSIGEACLIGYGMLFITTIMYGLFVMVLSELLRGGMPTLAVSAGLTIAGMIYTVPGQYRVLAQIWDWLPVKFLSTRNLFDIRLLTVLGHGFLSWQAVPALYLLCCLVLAAAGGRIYRKYQVSGR
ncbi:MAG: hypothetical protein HFI51_03230 [Lachnospiraceae bacterium]|nr:hypothetical protein [Lachnospiraceae bacterium]